MKKEILGVRWITGRSNIGLVAVITFENTWACYITTVTGHDQETDIQHIADYGSIITEREARGFFPNISADLNYKK